MLSLNSKTAVVSGGSSGIGFASVLHLLELGHRVAFFGQSSEHVEAACEQISQRHSAKFFLGRTVDMLEEGSIRRFFDEAVSSLGNPEILVCSAGISPKGPQGAALPLTELTLHEWDSVIAVNLTGAMLCCQLTLPYMQQACFGRIIFIGSVAGRTIPIIAGGAYAASKAGLSGLARSLIGQYSRFGVTINVVAPGRIVTQMAGDIDSPRNQAALTRIPVGRLGTVSDVANAVGFLVSEQSGFINGAILDVNGGEFAPV
ncbi:SDR family oxidoreductase [Brucella pituitosa]|uniref:SDR family oxidoreductase n=1 Tax=Brucella pituitosa TaxID=571256 RepID=A0ABS3K1Z3_9HYPH|nr:SDR family oxidoreductase [Brucella pituitosa]MBO1040919.1 SDR family oxidoreductase [Brucella pituitosa]